MQKRFIRRIRTFLQSAAVVLSACTFSAAIATPSDSQTLPTDATCPALLNKTFPPLKDDSPLNLCPYRFKVLLIVNTASYYGFTSQHEGLDALYARLEKQGLAGLDDRVIASSSSDATPDSTALATTLAWAPAAN